MKSYLFGKPTVRSNKYRHRNYWEPFEYQRWEKDIRDRWRYCRRRPFAGSRPVWHGGRDCHYRVLGFKYDTI